MSKRANKTGRNDQAARHVRIYHWIMKTPAWKDLSAYAVRVYIDMAARYGGPGSNNGRISYSSREAGAVCHRNKNIGAAALADLKDHGFIVPMVRGGFNVKKRHATEWRLTEFPCDVTRQPPTCDFKDWRLPQIQNTVTPAGLQVPPAGQDSHAQGTKAA